MWKIAAQRCRSTVKANVREEQLRPVDRDSVRHAHIADRSTRTCRAKLPASSRLFRAHAFQDGVSTDSFRQLFNSSDAFLAAFGNDIRCAELKGQLLP